MVTNDEANTSSQQPQGKLWRNTSTQVLQRRLLLNTSTRLQQKLQSRIQVSKSAQRKLHSRMYTSTQGFFFFLNRSDFREMESRNWNDGMLGS